MRQSLAQSIGALMEIARASRSRLALGMFVWFKLKSSDDAKPRIVFENSTSAAVDLKLDGSSVGTIAAGGAMTLAIDPGGHDVVAGSDKAHIDVARKDGFHALFAVGGKSSIVTASAFYGGSGNLKPMVYPVKFTGAERLAPIDGVAAVDMVVDKPFPDTVSTRGGRVTVVHLCHLRGDSVGCPNF
jgi:hypothetical protein